MIGVTLITFHKSYQTSSELLLFLPKIRLNTNILTNLSVPWPEVSRVNYYKRAKQERLLFGSIKLARYYCQIVQCKKYQPENELLKTLFTLGA